ncbi:sugar-binding protein, partial [Streptomyces sp. BF-3]
AAWKFIEFAASHASNSKWNEAAGAIPANTEAAKDPWISKTESTALAAKALTDGSTKVVDLPYYLPDWNNISKADNEPEFQKVLLGKTTAKQFLDKMAEELNAANKEWKELGNG